MGVCNCSMFCCTFLYVHFSIAIILMGKRELIALLNLSSWCLVMVERLFLTVPRGCLQFVIVVFPDHTHLLLLKWLLKMITALKTSDSEMLAPLKPYNPPQTQWNWIINRLVIAIQGWLLLRKRSQLNPQFPLRRVQNLFQNQLFLTGNLIEK